MTNSIAATDGGASYHQIALNDPRWADLIDARLYLPEIDRADLSRFDILLVTCRSNPELLVRHRHQIRAYLDQGGTVFVFGVTQPERWLPNVRAEAVDTNYWWWLERGADSGLRLAHGDHPIFDALSLEDMTWHHHARFEVPEGAVSIVDFMDGRSVFYDDPSTTAGRMLVTSLDPFFHHGSYFMPATTRFLEKFMPWVKNEFDPDTGPRLSPEG